MNLSKQITYYLRGKLTEQKAMDLWIERLKRPENLKLLEMERMLLAYFKNREIR